MPTATETAPALNKSGNGVREDAEVSRLREEIKDAKPGSERAQKQHALVDRLVALNRKQDALAELRTEMFEDRFDPAFFYNVGNALARLGDASAATDAYRKAISQRHGNYARALNNLGVILIRQGRWDEAQEALSAALTQENNTYAEASYNLGRLYMLRGENGLAIREWTRTLKLQHDHADAAAALARAYADDGNTGRALEVLDAFYARSTRSGDGVPLPITYARREIIEASNAETDAKKNEVKTARASSSANSNALPASITSVHRRSYSLDPDSYSLLQHARAARESGKNEESVKYYRGVLAHVSGNYFPPANLEMAYALINLHRQNEAIASLLPLVERDGARYPIAYYHLGRLYESLGQLTLAIESFTRAAAIYGDSNPQTLVDVSRVREKSGDMAGALAALESYVRAAERQGSVPAWATERLAKLRQQAAAMQTVVAPSEVKP